MNPVSFDKTKRLIMNLKFQISVILLVTLCAGFFVSLKTEASEVKSKRNQPNIVFILADDMGYGDLTCYNHESKISTPNIDQLAEAGIRFTNAHSPGAWCVPSRYGLITGRYPGRLPDLNTMQHSLIKPKQETLATLLKRHGYQTACIGKWHLGFDGVDWENPAKILEMKNGPIEKGFDYFFGMHASLDIPPYFYVENGRAVQSPTKTIDDHASPNATSDVSGAFFRGGGISPDFIHKEVLDQFQKKAFAFLDTHKKEHPKDPFFLYLPLTAPHTPWLPKPEFVGESEAGEYGDFTMQVDNLVGQVLAYLKDKDLLENTIVFFSSDNGPVWFQEDIEKFDHASVGVLRGMKGDMWEGGSRIPFIVSAPGRFSAGDVSDQTICFTDMMATLADIVGDESIHGADFDSHSFLPILNHPDSDQPTRDELVIERSSYRIGDWKFIDGSGQGGIAARWAPNKKYIVSEKIPGELYNLKSDLPEQNNLYDKYPEKVKEMKQRLNEILKSE